MENESQHHWGEGDASEHEEPASLGDRIEQLRAKLRPAGPAVDYAVLTAYVDGAPELKPEIREQVRRLVVTWENWFTAYWEMLADMREAAGGEASVDSTMKDE